MKDELQKIISALPVIQKAHIYEPEIEAVANASFEAGKQVGRQEGRREVVEWIKERQCYNDIGGVVSVDFMPGEWQAKFKEWGIGGAK